MSARSANILVTSALPYANGPIHIGHLVEYPDRHLGPVPAHARPPLHLRLRGRRPRHADHAQAEPRAHARALIERVLEEHRADFAFGVAFDNYRTTHSRARTGGCPGSSTSGCETAGTRRCGGPTGLRPGRRCSCRTATSRAVPALRGPDQVRRQLQVCGHTYTPTDLDRPGVGALGRAPGRARVRTTSCASATSSRC